MKAETKVESPTACTHCGGELDYVLPVPIPEFYPTIIIFL